MEESKPIFIYCYLHFLNEIITLIEVRRTSKHLIKGCFFIIQLEQQANKKQHVCTLKAAVWEEWFFSTAYNCQNPLDAKGQAQWHGKSLSSWTVQPIYGRNPRNCMTYQKENSYSLTLRTWEHKGKGAAQLSQRSRTAGRETLLAWEEAKYDWKHFFLQNSPTSSNFQRNLTLNVTIHPRSRAIHASVCGKLTTISHVLGDWLFLNVLFSSLIHTPEHSTRH